MFALNALEPNKSISADSARSIFDDGECGNFSASTNTMALEHWSGMMAAGENAEYFYNQSDRGCWAARKMGDRLEARNPAKRDLTREQVEALFRDPF